MVFESFLRPKYIVLLLVAGLVLGGALLQALGVVRGVPFRYNLRNLMVRWRVTLLTALAFTAVVALTIVMLAFVNGMDRLTEGSGQPGNVLVLSDGATDELFSNLGYGDVTRIEQLAGIQHDNDGKPLVSWELFVVANQQIPNAKPGERQRRFVQVRGIVDPVRSGNVHSLELHDGGKWFGEAGVENRSKQGSAAIQAVLGEGIARELAKDLRPAEESPGFWKRVSVLLFGEEKFKASLEAGDRFQLGGRDWEVVGVMKSAGSTFDSEVWAKADLVGDVFGKKTRTTVVVRTPDAAKAKEMATYLTEQFKSPAVQAQPETEYYEKLSATNQQFSFAIRFVAFFMAVGGVFGVMNTMYAAISQRTKDIGVLRILGYGRWQLLTSFFVEAILLALIGGVLGCAIGSLANGFTATSIISGGQGGGKTVVLHLTVDFSTLLTGIAFSLAMGCVGGLLPAIAATRLKPLDAVR